MQSCWEPCPAKRPSFAHIARTIENDLARKMGYLELGSFSQTPNETEVLLAEAPASPDVTEMN